jgi:hypothetical protein
MGRVGKKGDGDEWEINDKEEMVGGCSAGAFNTVRRMGVNLRLGWIDGDRIPEYQRNMGNGQLLDVK